MARPFRVLVLGAGGQVGRELTAVPVPAGLEVIGLARADCDVTDPAAPGAALARLRPDLVVNAAAYTAVDRAESEVEAAFAANAAGPGRVAQACASAAVPLIHVSTDYVFDGTKPTPYREDDPVAPIGAYGASKAAGEAAIRAALPTHVILRTAWVYGRHGGNFVKTMLRLARERDELRVVADQVGNPTAAYDIAEAILQVAAVIRDGGDAWGVFHYAGAGETSWHGFAEAIVGRAAATGLLPAGRRPRVTPIATADYPTPARRPARSTLDCAAIGRSWGVATRPWPAGLDRVLTQLAEAAPG